MAEHMPHAYTEDQLVEQPAIGLFAELGWTTVSAIEEVFGKAEPSSQPSPNGRGSEGEVRVALGRAALGRETPGEVVLESRLRAAVVELNRDRSAMSPAAANREVYLLLKEGIRVSVAEPEPSPQPSPKGRGS